MATVFIPTMLRPLTGGVKQIAVQASTVKQVIDCLEKLYPGVRDLLMEDDEDIRSHISVAVDGDIAQIGLLEEVGENSEVHFVPAIGGGSTRRTQAKFRTQGQVWAGTLGELKQSGCKLVTGGGHTIAVFYHNGRIHAVDNRCPHMGFPLDKGSVKDGILTCHWHHARFDLSSGGTFDPFADDVAVFPVRVVDDEVWVDPSPPESDMVQHWSARLEDGLEHGIRLVIAKSVLGLQAAGADYRVPLRIGAQFGATYSAQGWGPAMTILTCTANMLPDLKEEDRPLALYQGLMHVAQECSGRPPRFPINPLPTGETNPEVFSGWFRSFIDVRDEEGAERCLRTAIDLGLPPNVIGKMVFAAATDHIYIDSGHILDYANKSFELLDHLGWEHAGHVLTSLVHRMAQARRSQELNSWRHPIDLSSMVWEAREQTSTLYQRGQNMEVIWDREDELTAVVLQDDPAASIGAIKEAIGFGASPQALGSALAHAAFLRVARFHTSNEFGDWDTVHNTLTSAHALHQALVRVPSVELMRGLFDVAISIYLDRFLNMPAQRLPEPREPTEDRAALESLLLEHMNVQQQVEEVAQTVSSYLGNDAGPGNILATLGHAMLREDSQFHSFQMMDAGFKQYNSRKHTHPGNQVLVGVARFLAAHSPTSRAVGQTYLIARRLQRGEEIYSDT